MPEEAPYRVEVVREDGGWAAHILDGKGEVVFRRACADEGEARLFESTVRQHLGWLSPERFRRYYRLPG
jgi:hypothetical protein